jgi:hypothetical protein
MSDARKPVNVATDVVDSTNTHGHADTITKTDIDSDNSGSTSDAYGSGDDSFNIVKFKNIISSSDSDSENEKLKGASFNRTPVPSIVINDPDTPRQIHSPTRQVVSPTRIFDSPPKQGESPPRQLDSPPRDTDSPTSDPDSPPRNVESPPRDANTPPRQIPIPILMAMVQAISPSLYYGKEGEDATAHYYSFMDWLAEVARANPEAVALTEIVKIAMFKLTLRGEARNWIETLNFATLANLKAAFKDPFSKEPTREQDIESIVKNKLQPN